MAKHLRHRRLSEGDPNQACSVQLRGFAGVEEQRKTALLRYLTLEKFVSLLEFGAVWFSRLGALQDEFEGTLPIRAKEISEARDRELAEKIPVPLLRPTCLTMTSQSIHSCRGIAAVNCWFLGREESYEMWREYGQDGKGVAILSTVRRLSTSLMITGDFAAMTEIGRVKYVDFETHEMTADESDSVNAKAFLKSNMFAREQEVRIMTPNCLHSGCLNPDGTQVMETQFALRGPVDQNRKGFYVKVRLHELIQALIVGPNANAHSLTLIKRLVSRYRLFVEVNRSALPAKV